MDRIVIPMRANDPREDALLEIHAAIALVAAGVAVTVTLCCLEGAINAAFTGAVWAQAAGVAFSLRREAPSAIEVVVGPRLRLRPGTFAVATTAAAAAS